MQYVQHTFLQISVCNLEWWHWLLAMLIPFIIGYLLRNFLSGGNLKTKVSTLEGEKASLEAELKKAKSMKVAVAAPVSVDKSELNSLKDKVRDLDTHNAKLKVDIADALAVKQQYAGINLDALYKRITELEGVETRLSSDLQSQKALTASLTANTGDLDSLKAKLDHSESEIIRLSAQANALRTERDSIVRENDNINGLRNDIRDLSGKVGALTVENEQLKTKLTGSTADTGALDALKAQLAAALADTEGLKSQVSGLQATAGTLQADATAAAAAKEAADKAEAALTAAQANLREAQIEAGNLRLRLEQTEADKKAAEAKLAEAGSDTAALEPLKATVSSLEAQLADTNAKAAACGTENDGLKAKLAALSAELEQAKTAYAAAILPVVSPTPDDLKIVEGIGPKIEDLFNAAGIFTWKQLYNTPVERLKEILNDAGSRFQIHDPSTWPEQARLADEGKLDELKALQDRLNAGKE